MIKLNKIQLDQIKYEAIASYPIECCGLLIGTTHNNLHTINNIIPCNNAVKSPGNDRFEIDPQDRINQECRLRGTRNSVIGHFHSHPDCPSKPSKIDIEMAYEPKMIWLIISVMKGKFQEFGTYQLNKSKQEYIKLSCEIIN